jgi:hypothetical protein
MILNTIMQLKYFHLRKKYVGNGAGSVERRKRMVKKPFVGLCMAGATRFLSLVTFAGKRARWILQWYSNVSVGFGSWAGVR